VTAGQDDAAMINFLRRGQRLAGESGPLDQRATAGRTPVCHGLFGEHGAALSANAFHTSKITGSGRNLSAAKLEICTLPFGWWQSMWMER
jgi:hypothetical protein